MRKYDEYKDSGFEWIGEVPSQWSNLRLRFVCEFRNGYTPSKANPEFWEDGSIPWYRMEDIRETGRKLYEAKQYITEEAVKGGGLFEAGSFILATTATIGEHAVLIVDSLANQRFTNLKIRKSLKARLLRDYFYYYLFVIDDYCKATTKTSTFPAVSMELLKNCHVVFPSPVQQQFIATYLDKKCGEIDKVISAQQKRIALLQELKQSVITHAVTKGLNPNVEMKDSGVEWIGEVPRHWKIMAIKHLIDLLTDYDANGSFADIAKNCNINNGNPYAWMVRTTDLVNKRYGIVDGNNYCDLKTYKYLKKSSLLPNDIIIAKRGDIGKVFLIPNMSIPMTLAPNTYLLKTKKLKVYNVYLFYVLSSECGQISLSLNNKSTTLGAIYKDDVKAISISVPPLSEQKVIATYLDKKCASIDSSISKAQHQVALLQEYKQSLITEVVTGKRKVC